MSPWVELCLLRGQTMRQPMTMTERDCRCAWYLAEYHWKVDSLGAVALSTRRRSNY